MDFSFKSNKGKITESLVNRTINFYTDHNIAVFKKSEPKVAQIQKDGMLISGQICSKAEADYYGLYQGKFFAFEVKETRSTNFSFLQLKEHQIESLKQVHEHGGISFLMINFLSHESLVYIIPYERLEKLFENKVRRIEVHMVRSIGIQIPVEFPGIIDWIKYWSLNNGR